MGKELMPQDHDLLIRVDTKLDFLSSEVKAMHAATNAKVTALEARVSNAEKVITESAPTENLRKLHEVYDWYKGFSVGWKVILGITSFISTVVTVIAYTLIILGKGGHL